MFTTLYNLLKNLFAAYKIARAEAAAKDVSRTQPLVEHADTAASDVAGELRRVTESGVAPTSTPRLPN